MKQYKYIFFDLDGTLTNPEMGITNCVAFALEKFGIHVENKKTLRKFIGPPLIPAFQQFYGLTKEESTQALIFYRERFSTLGLFENEIYPNIEDVLKTIKYKNKKIILATSKPEVYAQKILEHFGLHSYFDYIVGATMDESRSEKDAVIAYALKCANITDKSSVIMIGDTKFDGIGAAKNNIDFLGVLYGFGSKIDLELAGAKYFAEDVLDILTYI
ncbi:MAG: HAD family hydrolase [Spirochaetaceae bacterium]|nr:HAD family hydrolase [Spirochaetaceae bacterium]